MVKTKKASEKARGKRKPSKWALKQFDGAYFRKGEVERVGGVDEAGRGCLAGPVVAAAVVVDEAFFIEGLNDSKQLSAQQREALFPQIRRLAPDAAVGWATALEVDRLNVLEATLLAASRAVSVLKVQPDLWLTDYLNLKGVDRPVEPLVKGDARSQAIAAASVLAKVTRDRWMRRLDGEYPEYGFASNKGYGSKAHRQALADRGSSTAHRHSFRGVDWFDLDYATSVSLKNLLGRVKKGELDPLKAEEIWLNEGYGLPECEEEAFFHALGVKTR